MSRPVLIYVPCTATRRKDQEGTTGQWAGPTKVGLVMGSEGLACFPFLLTV